ncbi:MAG: autotransporter-associated beta strand repeat-containing protein, partial [Flammeovirgaceae bacterium]|nr:autotransporter-associated beta strand repeat-containing protein [Flammeovirgaceae bacterium]
MNFILPLPRRKRLQRTTLLFAFFLGFISLGFSQGNFNSNASGNWTTVGTWTLVSGVDGDGIPDANDVVTILNTHAVFVSDGTATPSTHACSSLTINSGGTLRANSGLIVRTLNISNSLTIAAGGTYTVADAGTTETHFLNIGGNFTNNGGTFTPLINNTALQVTFNGTGAQAINGTVATQTFNSVIVNKTAGTLSAGGSTTSLTFSNFTQTLGDFTAPATFNVTGNIVLTAGTFTAGTNASVGGNFTRNGGAFTPGAGTFTFNGTGQTLGGTLSTTFNNLTINSGTVTLGRNTVTSGTLSIINPGALALSTFNHNSNGLLSLNGGSISGTGTLTLAGNVTTNSSATTATISAPTTLSSTQTLTVGNGAATPDLSITSVVTGAAGLIKSGTGELTLSGANTFTGGVTLTDGILNINNSSALGTVAGTFTISGGTINNTSAGAITTLNYPQAWNGDFTFTGTQNLNLGTGAITPNANRLVTVNAGILTVNGAIGGGAVSITKGGAGTLLIGGSNTFTGGVNINAGILRLGNAGALNSTTPNAVTFGAGSTGILQLNGNSVTISALNTNATVGSPIVEDGVVGTHTLTIDASGANTFAGLLRNGSAGTLAITKTGVGSLALSGNNAYSGSTTLSSGTLSINSSTAIGTGTFVVAGGSIDNTSAGAITLTSNNPQSWNSDFTFVGSQNLNLGTGAVTPNASRSLTINASTLTVGGVIGGGAIGISKTGNGQLTLSGANTFSGGFTLNAGVLNINNSSALGTVAGTFTINGGTIDNTTAGAISTLNYPQAWNNNFTFLGTQNLNLGSGNVSFSANRTITVSANTLTVGGAISAATFNLIKLGGGTLSFGSNAVAINSLALSAGTLTSTSGTLTVSGDFTNSGTFNNNGGTVAYNGIVPQAVASVTYNNLILSGAGQKNASGNCTVGGNLTNSSVFDLGNNTLSVSGAINNTGGTIRFSSASNGIALNTGTVEYYGASQLVTAGIYNNLIINQSSGEALLAGDVTVNGVLTLTSGRLNIGSFNLTLGSTASISVAGPTASKMIVATGGGGEVRKIFTANGTFAFPIGDNTGLSEYSPITVAVSGTGYSSAYVGVSVVDAKHPSNASAVNFLSRYWNVTQSGITSGAAIVTATYSNADINGSEASMTTAALNGAFNQVTNPWARYLTTALGSNTLTTTVAAPLTSGQISAVTAITRANPTVNIVGGGVSSCSGSPVSLTANGVGDPGFIYSWLPVAGLSSPTIANPIASPTTTTVYTVTATDGNGIQATNNTTITVNPLPTLTGAIQSATVCAGSGALINLTGLLPGSTSTISYSINGVAQTPVAGVVANGAGAGSFTTSNLSAGNNGQNLQVTGITVTSATPNCSASFAQNALLSVDSPALITVQPIANTTLCVGSPFNLSVTATGIGLTYQWLKGASNISGATGSTFTIPSVVSTDAGLYSVIVTSAGVCLPTTATSAASTLTINTAPAITTQPIASQTVCEGAVNTTFSVVATGTSLTYQWKKNGVDIGGATSASYIIPTAATGDVGTYTVQVSGTCAPSVTSTGSVLNINEQPEIITVTGNQTVCEGSSVTFTVNAGVTTTPTYQWRFNTTPIAGATNSSYTIPTTTTGDAGSYDVVVSGTCTPSATSAASTLTINTAPVITTQPIASQTVCEGGVNTTFSVVATGTGL